MAKERDMIDEIIDLQDNFLAVRNPLGNVANQLMGDPDAIPHYNPADYKDKPRMSLPSCLRSTSDGQDVCDRCARVCPVAAITYDGKKVIIEDNCRKCGLCIAACPTEAFIARRQMARNLYDEIARVASTYDDCYITCTRALGRLPKDNEVLLPCVGVMPSELWFSLLAEYSNISVYLPLGICDRCRTVTGEEYYSEAIAEGEEHSIFSVGLEVDETNMTHEQSRAFKRRQFMSSMAQAGTTLVTAGNPAVSGVQAVANRIKAHSNQINTLQRTLEQVTGMKNEELRRRQLTQKRKLVLSTLQSHPKLADRMVWEVPACDASRCTVCGDCVKLCPVRACSLDATGHFSVEPTYCVNCGACTQACPEHALEMKRINSRKMIVPDPAAEQVAKQRAQIQAVKKKSKKMLKTGLSALETFADELSKPE